MAKEEKVWVASATGQPVHLVDRSLKKNANDDYIHISISRQMAIEGIGVEVPKTDFIDQKVAEKLIQLLPDKATAKKAHDDFMKKRKAEVKNQEQNQSMLEQYAKKTGQAVEKTILDMGQVGVVVQ